MARRHRIPVVITNQVYMEIETANLRPLGGMAMYHATKTSIRHQDLDTPPRPRYATKTSIFLEKKGEGKRLARLMKHRPMPEGTTAELRITARSVE